jgi:diguanylate cyclase (GGDEF)-like protein
VKLRRVRPTRDDGSHPIEAPFASKGRPKAERGPIVWTPIVLRFLVLAWAAAIVAALFDEFGPVSHLPFLMAMAMTGLLVGATWLWTNYKDYIDVPPKREGDTTNDDANDDLTDLPTFNYFSRRLTDEFNRSRRMGRQVAVVLIDVNNLTAVNKEYGVHAGDEVLRHVARAVDGTRRYNDIVARLGDDEFGIILLDTGDTGVTAFIERLEERLAREAAGAEVAGRSVSLWAGVCSGSAVSSPDTMQAEAVLSAAMASLNQAKQERERRRRMWLSA